MEIFDLDDERALSTALQAQLRQHHKRAGLILLGSESGEPLRLGRTPQQVQKMGAATVGSMPTSWRRRCTFTAIPAGRSPSVMPQACRRRVSTG